MKHIMVIAGSDSSGGAGLTRDIAVATELGCAVRPVITNVTAQTDLAVHNIHSVPPSVVEAQIETALDHHLPDAIKIGMLGTPDIAASTAAALRGIDIPIVLDPVLKSSSGSALAETSQVNSMLSQATLVTPNLAEAAALTNSALATAEDEITLQASVLLQMGVRSVLIKGGHGVGSESVDHLVYEFGHRRFSSKRLSKGRRGTGCALSTAIACNLAMGFGLATACENAKAFVHMWIAAPQ
ncbi:MAG: hydroxymethylpyrimidine/phosphomethylpyrimidine kinase [Pseudomonadota bacterium]